MSAYFLVAMIGAAIGVGLLAFAQWKETKDVVGTASDLLRNGGFESEVESWGTGSIEERIRAGNKPEDFKRLPYVVGDLLNSLTNSWGQIDKDIKHGGQASYRFNHLHQPEPHRWGSLSQRVHGVLPGKWYEVGFWVRADAAPERAFFVTTDIPWHDRTYVPGGTYEWQRRTHKFFSGSERYADIRFVIEQPCTVWLDDVSLRALPASEK